MGRKPKAEGEPVTPKKPARFAAFVQDEDGRFRMVMDNAISAKEATTIAQQTQLTGKVFIASIHKEGELVAPKMSQLV